MAELPTNNADNYGKMECISTYYSNGGGGADNGVGAAAVCGEVGRMETIPEESSIFIAEVYAIVLAMGVVNGSKEEEFVLFSDSYSVLTKLPTLLYSDAYIRAL